MTSAQAHLDDDDFRPDYLQRAAALRHIRATVPGLTLVASAGCVSFSNPGAAGIGVVYALRSSVEQAALDAERTAGSVRTTAPRAALAAVLLAASSVDSGQMLIVETASRYVFDIAKRKTGATANADLWSALDALGEARLRAGGAPIEWRLVDPRALGSMRRASALALRAAEDANRRRLGRLSRGPG